MSPACPTAREMSGYFAENSAADNVRLISTLVVERLKPTSSESRVRLQEVWSGLGLGPGSSLSVSPIISSFLAQFKPEVSEQCIFSHKKWNGKGKNPPPPLPPLTREDKRGRVEM